MSLSMIKTAPPVVSSEIAQQFAEGKIEIRGHYPNLFFKAEDVATYFQIPNLIETVMAEDNGFQRGIHYQEYFVPILVNQKFYRNKKNLFLTQIGLMVFIFIHRTSTTEPFQESASKILCCHNFGTLHEKMALAADLINSKTYVIKDIFDHPGLTTTPSAYIFSIGSVGLLREKLDIDPKFSDKMIVCAFGCAPNVYTTLTTYCQEFPESDPDIVASTYVDPVFRTDAERKLSSMLNIFKFSNDHEKLIIVPVSWTTSKAASDILQTIHKRFAGTLTEMSRRTENLIRANKELERKVDDLKSQNKKESELARQACQIQAQIHDKEIEILRGQIQCKDVLIKQLELEVQNWKYQGQLYEQECLLYESNRERESILS